MCAFVKVTKTGKCVKVAVPGEVSLPLQGENIVFLVGFEVCIFAGKAETLTEEVVEKLKKKSNLTCKFVKLEKVGRKRAGNYARITIPKIFWKIFNKKDYAYIVSSYNNHKALYIIPCKIPNFQHVEKTLQHLTKIPSHPLI